MYEGLLTEIGPGWYNLVRPLIQRCRQEGIHIYRIKQKLGGLRFEAESGTRGKATDELRRLIQAAERKSLTVCEECGEPGKGYGTLADGDRIRTRCDTHANL